MEPHSSFRLLFLLALCALISLLQTPTNASPDAMTSRASCIVKTVPGLPYSYNEKTGKGPSDWGGLKGFKACGEGRSQSPIDFPIESDAVRFRPLSNGPRASIPSSMFTFSPDSENWAMNCANKRTCGYTVFNGAKYWVQNIHFHTNAEHTLNGKQFPLEAHIVHANFAETRFVVIATMFGYPPAGVYDTVIHEMGNREYGANDVVQKILTAVVNDEPTATIPLGGMVNLKEGICSYNGSLTTPPCSEAVTLLMQLKPMWVSREQVRTYLLTVGGGLNGNNRPVQPLNNRKVTCFV